MNCSVCGKPAAEGANVCSISCLMVLQHGGERPGESNNTDEHKPLRVGKSPGHVHSLVNKLQEISRNTSRLEQEVPMLILKHNRLRGRNLVVNGTVFSFDIQGIAKVKDLGSVRDDIEALLRRDVHVSLLHDPKNPKQEVAVEVPTPVVEEKSAVIAVETPAPISVPTVQEVVLPEITPAPQLPSVAPVVVAAPSVEQPIRKPIKQPLKKRKE